MFDLIVLLSTMLLESTSSNSWSTLERAAVQKQAVKGIVRKLDHDANFVQLYSQCSDVIIIVAYATSFVAMIARRKDVSLIAHRLF